MGHLQSFRTGWEGERLAEYLLSRFSFVAQPTTIADDLGSDFYCTIFDLTDDAHPKVEPRISFAIQIKSNNRIIEAHNKVHYLHNLEIPFFLGVVSQSKAELKIYSAERYPMLTARFGLRPKLWLRPVDTDTLPDYCDGETDPEGVTLDCYHVCTFTAHEDRKDIQPSVDKLLTICHRATGNIRSRLSEEHIYQWDDNATIFSIVAGVGSIKYFRDNLYKRLAEAFYNFEFLLNAHTETFRLEEFRVYEKFYLALAASYATPMLNLAHDMYGRLKAIVDQRFPDS